MRPILDELSGSDVVNLAMKFFCFTRSDSYRDDAGTPHCVPLVEAHADGRVSVRMNVHRAQPEDFAPEEVKRSFERFVAAIESATPSQVVLTATRAAAIRNTNCLHGRDSISDPRRLLIRLFGYSRQAVPQVIQADPMIVKG